MLLEGRRLLLRLAGFGVLLLRPQPQRRALVGQLPAQGAELLQLA